MTKATTIYGALAAAQAEMSRANKGASNPHFRSKYADLGAVQDACLPALHKHGFAVYQPLIRDAEGLAVQTILAHESGEKLECSIPLLLGQRHDMQGLGSAITYARRYGLFCMSGVAPEDDDGNKATEQAPKAAPAKPAEPAYDPHAAAEFLLAALERCPDEELANFKGVHAAALSRLYAADKEEFERVKAAKAARDDYEVIITRDAATPEPEPVK